MLSKSFDAEIIIHSDAYGAALVCQGWCKMLEIATNQPARSWWEGVVLEEEG